MASLLIFFAGALLTLGFAPFSLWPLPIIGLVYLLRHKSLSFFKGFIFGLGFFSTCVSWVYVSIHDYGDSNMIVAALITALFVAYLSLYPAIFAWLSGKIISRTPFWLQLYLIPLTWTLLEWLRGHFLTGFPWAYLGISTLHSPLKGFAPIIGVYGESFLTVLFATVISYAWEASKHIRIAAISSLVIISLVGITLHQIHWTNAEKTPLRIALVQPNISQDLKWMSEHQQEIIDTNLELSAPFWGTDLIIWPESAITVPLPYSQRLITQLQQLTQNVHSTLITGIPELADAKDQTYYNAVAVINTKTQLYHKRHLVPFGEYVPLENWLRGVIRFLDLPMSNFIGGKANQPLLVANGVPLQTLVCYEIAYPELTLNGSENSKAILTLSNDAWFGHSIGPKQHLELAQFRALESGKPVIRDTNNGITALINAQGDILEKIEPFKATVLHSTLLISSGSTPITTLGPDRFLCYLTIIGLILCLTFRYRSNP